MTRRHSLWLAGVLCGGLILQLLLIERLPLVMDEFQGAASAYELTRGIPYRDFHPYKPLLGYAFQLPLLSAIENSWTALIAVKVEIALILSVGLFFLYRRLVPRFRPISVILGAAVLVSSPTWLERAAELRVDTLAGLFGAFAMVLLLEKRARAAGIVAGLAFLISQKAVFFPIAAVAALASGAGTWKILRHRNRGLVQFGAASATVVAAYVVGCMLAASPAEVLSGLFGRAGVAVTIEAYDIRWQYWSQTLTRSALFWGLTATGLLVTLVQAIRRPRQKDAMALSGVLVVLLSAGFLMKQPWPYFFPMLMPTLALGVIVALDRLLRAAKLRPALVTTAIVAACLTQAVVRLPAYLARHNSHQRATVELIDRLLGEGDSYLAGVDLLYRRRQQPRELSWLDRPRLARLEALTATELDALATRLEVEPNTLLVANYRLQSLPEPLRARLAARFVHWSGNIWLATNHDRADIKPDPRFQDARPLFPDVYDY